MNLASIWVYSKDQIVKVQECAQMLPRTRLSDITDIGYSLARVYANEPIHVTLSGNFRCEDAIMMKPVRADNQFEADCTSTSGAEAIGLYAGNFVTAPHVAIFQLPPIDTVLITDQSQKYMLCLGDSGILEESSYVWASIPKSNITVFRAKREPVLSASRS